LEGTVANNVLTYGVGGLNIDGTRVGTDDKWQATGTQSAPSQTLQGGVDGSLNVSVSSTHPQGRFPANFIHDGSDEVVALFPDTKSGAIKPYVRNKENVNVDFLQGTNEVEKSFDYGDNGSAARFFYCAKASKRDRNEGLEGFEKKITNDNTPPGTKGSNSLRAGAGRGGATANHHPTVKPTTLMQYLVRLVTPPNGIVLDPFMGSGSTGKACAYEGFDFIGIDQSAEYVAIAQARIDFATNDKLPL